MAQLDSALDSDSKGQRFESARVGQKKHLLRQVLFSLRRSPCPSENRFLDKRDLPWYNVLNSYEVKKMEKSKFVPAEITVTVVTDTDIICTSDKLPVENDNEGNWGGLKKL